VDECFDEIRKKRFVFEKHFVYRELSRLDYQKIRQILDEGELHQEGKHKYRVSLGLGRKKIAFVVFESYPMYNKLKTAGITSRKKRKR
jgi:hypothetical protein